MRALRLPTALVLFSATAAPAGVGPASPAHDLHVAYGDLSVSETVAVLRIRMFRDDLETALLRRAEADPSRAGATRDERFLAYFNDSFRLEADGSALTARVIGRGEDQLDAEQVSWYILRFNADAPIRSARIVNRLLFEVFDDQRNLVNVVHVPDETRRVFYFSRGDEEIEIEF